MTLLSKLMSGDAYLGPNRHVGTDEPAFDVRRRLRESFAIDCRSLDMEALYNAAKGDGWEDCRSPFTNCWIELGGQGRLRWKEQGNDGAIVVRATFEPGALVGIGERGDKIPAEEVEEALLIRHFIEITSNKIPRSRGVYATADTVVVKPKKLSRVFIGSKFLGDPLLVPRECEDAADAMAALVLAIFHFLNASNVAIAPTPSTLGMLRKARRKKKPFRGITWNHLVVTKPGSPKVISPAAIDSGVKVEPLVSEHFCRGHFKTYGEERPLFGKWSGRFWWSPQVRGSSEVGTAFKDYELREETRSP